MEKWENPQLMSENRMNSHANFPEESVSLNGSWRFLCVKASDTLPEQFYIPEFSSKSWTKVQVPSSWESQNYVEPFFFEKVPHPALFFKDRNCPSVNSEKNTIGIYRKRFSIDSSWCNQKVILRFSAVSNFFQVWLNGKYIGMCKGSLTPIEFDISAVMQEGYNYLCVKVLRFSDASHLDHPGCWLQSGIIGNVDIYPLPKQHIADLYAKTAFGDNLKDAVTEVQLSTENADGLTVRIAIMDGQKVSYYGEGLVENNHAKVIIPCNSPKLWSAEIPYLYKIAVILWDGVAIVHTRQLMYGFRKISVEHTALEENSKPLTIKGVCYNYSDSKSMEQDIKLIKQCNMNAIRVRGMIPEEFYDLCDQYGLYVLDDCSTEQENSAWDLLYTQRSLEKVICHRNHPSVFIWNLSSSKSSIYDYDTTRPTCSEDLYCVTFPNLQRIQKMENMEDLIEKPDGLARMLSAPKVVSADTYRQYPLLALSYGGASGNSAQHLIAYADVFRKSKHWVGGFFWNFKDQNLIEAAPKESAVGLVNKEGMPHHFYFELQKAYQWIRCKRQEDGSICIKNHYRFLSTDAFDCCYQITRDGEQISGDRLQLQIDPGKTETIQIPIPDSIYMAGHYHLTIIFTKKEHFSEYDASTAYFQWEIANNPHISDLNPGGTIRDNNSCIFMKSENITYEINRNTGNIDQIRMGNDPLLKSPISPAFYRVRTDSEFPAYRRLDDWAKMTLKNQFPKPSVVEVDHMAHQITVTQNIGSGLMRRYQIFKDGTLVIELRLRTGKTTPNRIGLQTELMSSFQHMKWIGCGPWDTYSDRNQYGWFGIHQQHIHQQDEFARAQEHGNKQSVIQAMISDDCGRTILIQAEDHIECSLVPYSLSDLENGNQAHTSSFLNINCMQDGLSIQSVKPHYTYIYTFSIKPQI